ncbi:MAG: polysaccharide deacetylase family protein [bacterium]
MFVPILAYHMVQPNMDLGITNITPHRFEKQIRYLHQNGYRTVSLTDLVSDTGNDDLRGNKLVAITFDDAYQSVFEFAFPILKKFNFTATIFVISDYVGKCNGWDYSFLRPGVLHCDWDELKMLSLSGWEIGSHTANHKSLSSLPNNHVWDELTRSKETIENEMQVPVTVLSYPFGAFDGRVIHLAYKAGYTCACTLGNPLAERRFSPFALSRRGVYSIDPFFLFKVKLQNNRLSHLDAQKQRLITFCSKGTILYHHIFR